MRLLLALLGVALVAAQYRPGCPPTNYTAITQTMNLAALPPGGKYAICRPATFTDTDTDTVIDFTVSRGVFRLRNSHLIVDGNVRIVFEWPGLPDWADSSISGFPVSLAFDTEPNDLHWNGVTIEGAPEPVEDSRRRSSHSYHHSLPTIGSCGRMDNVNVRDVDDNIFTLTFTRCDGHTTLKRVSTFQGDGGMFFSDSNGVIVYDTVHSGTFPNDAPVNDEFDYDAVSITNSNITFIRPIIAATENGFEIADGSHVTLCNPYILAGLQGGVSAPLRLGTFGAIGEPVYVAVAGATNLHFEPDQQAISWRDNAQGMVAILDHCPTKLSTYYNMKEWLDFYTP